MLRSEDRDRGPDMRRLYGYEMRSMQGCIHIYGCTALRAKIRPDKAESEGCGGSTVKDDNEVWPDFLRNPKGRGHFSSFRRQSSLGDTRYPSLLFPRTEKKWLPSPRARICGYTLLLNGHQLQRRLGDVLGADLEFLHQFPGRAGLAEAVVDADGAVMTGMPESTGCRRESGDAAGESADLVLLGGDDDAGLARGANDRLRNRWA